MEKPLIVFRADGNPKTGLGHVSRCLALVNKVSGQARTCFLIRDTDKKLLDEISNQVDHLFLLDTAASFSDELRVIRENFPEPVVFVVDSYSHKLNYHREIRSLGHLLVCIDDLHDHSVVADHLINIGSSQLENVYDLPFYTRTYFGFRYAFLKAPFLDLAGETIQVNEFPEKIEQIFLCFGGADPDNFTLSTLKEMYLIFPEAIFHVVVGGMYEHKEKLDQFIAEHPGIKIYSGLSPVEMAGLMRDCQLGIISSSTISFEFLCSRARLIVRRTAENQQLIHSWLVESGLALDYTSLNENFFDSISKLSFCKRSEILHERLEFDYSVLIGRWLMESQLSLRPAEANDSRLYFEWANDPLTRSQSFQTNPIPWEDHISWFERKLQSPSTRMLLLMHEQMPVGQLRFEISGERATINYSISPSFRGKDLGSLLISKAVQWLWKSDPKLSEVDGFVKPDNIASQKAFKKNRFKEEKVILEGKEEMHYLLRLV